jgi:hypothetical protein
MRRTLIFIAVVAFVGSATLPTASAFRAWQLVSQETVEGLWESVDYDELKVYRLEVKAGAAVLVVTAGSKQAEFVFRASKVTVKAGKVSFVAVEAMGGPTVRITGEGKVLDAQGRMKLRIVNLSKELTYWGNTERLFIKGPAKSRLEALMEMDERASTLQSGAAQPCCAAAGSARFQPPENEIQSKEAKKPQ